MVAGTEGLIVLQPLVMQWRTPWERNPCLATFLLIANEVGERLEICLNRLKPHHNLGPDAATSVTWPAPASETSSYKVITECSTYLNPLTSLIH